MALFSRLVTLLTKLGGSSVTPLLLTPEMRVPAPSKKKAEEPLLLTPEMRVAAPAKKAAAKKGSAKTAVTKK
tara:strand:- start:432 stop:647 length:216 start_codon:yes stop_codon:yes gene_type:complete